MSKFITKAMFHILKDENYRIKLQARSELNNVPEVLNVRMNEIYKKLTTIK